MKNMLKVNKIHDFLKIIKAYKEHHKLMIFFDLDSTLIWEDETGEDVLIESDATKKLFKYLHDKDIWYTFCTARYYDVVLQEKKRKKHLGDIKENIEKLYEIFTELGIDCSEYKNDRSEEIVLKRHNKPVGLLYKGVLLGDKKGPIIKQFREQYDLESTYPDVVFIDDVDEYLDSVTENVPGCLIVKREL